MSKQSQRRRNARMIKAAAKQGPILIEGIGVEWIQASESEGDAPKLKRFSMKAYTGGPMNIGGYGDPVIIDLSGLKANATIPILRDHDLSRVVGHADVVEIGDSSLNLAGVIYGAGPDAAEVQAAASNGFPWKASVGVRPEKIEFVGEGVATKVNGKTFTGPLHVTRKGTLGEVSIVAIGADRKATANLAASAAEYRETDMEFKQWIEAFGVDVAELREDQLQRYQATYDAEVESIEAKAALAKIEAAESGDLDKIDAADKPAVVSVPTFVLADVVLGYETHITAIEAKSEDYRDKVPEKDFATICAAARKGAIEAKATALKEEWPTVRLEAEYIKAAAQFEANLMVAERPKGPAIHSSSRDGVTDDILAAAVLVTGKIGKPEDHCSPELLEAAHKQFPRGIGLQEMIIASARANGWSGYSFKQDGSNCMRYAFAPIQAGGFSTVSISGILSNIANKFLLEGFDFIETAWREIASIRPVSDFKTITSYRMTGETTYKLVPPTGEIPHGTLGEETFTNKADTYGLRLAVTRTDIINDDLGAITTVPRQLGLGGGRTLNNLFWKIYLAAQGTLFTTGQNNFFDGADSALSIDSLTQAEKLFMDLLDTDKNPIGHMPLILLVSTDNSALSASLFNSTEIRNPSASQRFPINNPHAGKFRPVVSRYMGLSSISGSSTTAWNLLASPQELSTVEVCFLNGQQTPIIETADANFDTLGVQMRGYFDFGIKEQDGRGGVRSKGAA